MRFASFKHIEGKNFLSFTQQFTAVFLNDVDYIALNFGQANTQVTLHDKFDAFQLHSVDVEVEPIVNITLSTLLNHLFTVANFSEHALNEAELEREKFWRHFFVLKQRSHLEKLQVLALVVIISSDTTSVDLL